MARLQDFNTVTPTNSDNILIVQSTGQGLASVGSILGAKMDKANPTGTGSLSIGRKSGTTVGVKSVAVGNDTTASGETSYAEGYQTIASALSSHSEGYQTTASGFSSHSEGVGTIANHRSQHVFGDYNVEDTSTATSMNKGNYVEIVGNGTSNTRSNARTLDWSGNETLAGDLTYKGNQVLSSMLMSYKLKSGSPIILPVNRYTTLLVIGLAQGIGSIGLMVVINSAAISSVINLATATAFSNAHLTFSLSDNVLTIASDKENESIFTIIRSS